MSELHLDSQHILVTMYETKNFFVENKEEIWIRLIIQKMWKQDNCQSGL